MANSLTYCYLLSFLLIFVYPSFGNKIDSLKSDDDVLAFLPPFFSDFQRGFSFERTINDTPRGDSLNAHNWFKTDIDNNGETDLVVFELRYGPRLFAILSIKGKFKKIIGANGYNADFIYPVLKRLDNRNVILLHHLNQISFDRVTSAETTTPMKSDTITVLGNCFVNHLKSPRHYRIEKIEIYNNGACEGECPKIDVVIYPQAYISKCKKTEWWNKGKKHLGKLSASKIKDIIYLFNNSNFSYFKNRYENDWSDQTTTTMIITYDGGKKKTISDYGSSSGNFTLNSIYRFAFDIAWN